MSSSKGMGRGLAIALWLGLGLAAGVLARAAWRGQVEIAGMEPHRAHVEAPHGHGDHAHGEHGHAEEQPEPAPDADALLAALARGERLAIDLGNPSCPIMGNRADPGVNVEWEGLLVSFCCPGCDEEFLQEPKRYLDELGIDPGPARAAIARVEAAEEGEQRAALEEALTRFRLHVLPPDGGARQQ
jgi:hypothetical protein